jgi:hypothetical protein
VIGGEKGWGLLHLPDMKTAASSLLFTCLALLAPAAFPQQPPSRPTVLITAQIESDTSTSTSGAATRVGDVVIAGGGRSSSAYEHSEAWEVVRRFSEECQAATFVTNPQTPHTFTIHTDYQKVSSIVIGSHAPQPRAVPIPRTCGSWARSRSDRGWCPPAW